MLWGPKINKKDPRQDRVSIRPMNIATWSMTDMVLQDSWAALLSWRTQVLGTLEANGSGWYPSWELPLDKEDHCSPAHHTLSEGSPDTLMVNAGFPRQVPYFNWPLKDCSASAASIQSCISSSRSTPARAFSHKESRSLRLSFIETEHGML